MSAPNFIRPLLRAALLLLLLAGILSSVQAAPTQLIFSNAGGIGATFAEDGQGGSTDIPGITLQIFHTSNAAGTPAAGMTWQDNTFFLSDDPSWNGLTHVDNAGRFGLAIRSANGRRFSIASFKYYNWGETLDTTYTVEGYRGGAVVGSRNFSIPPGLSIPLTVSLPAGIFGDVDEVRIRTLSGGTNINSSWHSINNLLVEAANTAPADMTLSNPSVGQSAGVNAVIGTLSTTDADAGDTFTYALASGAGDSGNASFNISGNTLRANDARTLAAGGVSIRLRSTDSAGASVEKIFNLTVIDDLAPAVASIAPSGSPPATATSMTFDAVFSEPVSNVSTDDFTVVGTGSAAGSVGAVSGSGTTYAVTVTGITGNGTLRLNLNSGTNVVDTAGNAAAAFTAGSTHTVAIPTAPGAPIIGIATALDGQASVPFTAPPDNGGSIITGYTVTASPGGMTVGGAGSPLLVTGLDNGTAYTFTVTATNAIGTGVASSASNAVTPKAAQSITFANPGTQIFGTTPTLTASSSAGLAVTFTSSTTAVCTITSGGTVAFISAGTCSITAGQAGNGAIAAAADVMQSFTVNAITPTAPTIGTATAGDAQATVTFTAPASNGGAPITSYTVTANPGGNTGIGAGSPITVTGLTNGVNYTFSVAATNNVGTGNGSAASNAVIPASPQTITFANPGAQNYGTMPTLTATSTSGLPVSFTSATPGVCTITSGGVLAFVTAGTCTVRADQSGNSSYLAANPVSQSFTVNPVVPGAPTAAVATPSGTGEIKVAFSAPLSSGGAAITSYTVTSIPGGITALGAGSPITVSGLTVGQTYTFTVTATNSSGTSAPSPASNAAVAADAIVASPSSATVPYGAGSVVPLAISGVASTVSIVSAPTHGATSVVGTTVTYTPTPGYAGTDSFSFQASDGNMTSATAVVSLTVSAPTLATSPASLTAATAGTAYTQTLVTSGGAAPYGYQVQGGSLPTGMTLSAAGVLAGTPTAAGTYTFSVRATDSSTGSGPFHVDTAYTLQVSAPQIGFTLSTLPQSSTAIAYTQQLQVSGGVAPYSFQVSAGALPSGLSLGSDGTFSGTPTGAGSYAFTVTVTDGNGFTASQAFTLNVIEAVQQITAFVANPTAPVYSIDGRFTVSASGGASGSPVLFATTTPAICRVEGSAVVMLAAGRCSLTADQAGNAQYQAAAQVTLDVDITAAVPVLQWPQELHKVFGEAAFDLADPQSPSRGTFSYSSSNTSVATVQGRTVTVAGEGVTILTVTQAAAGGFAVGTAQLRLVVSQRPDPSRDPGVIAGLQAQVDASVRFASAQQANIRDRLRQVRGGSNTSSNQVSLSYSGGNDLPSVSVPMSRLGGDALPTLPAGWGMWASGTASYGAGAGRSSYDFRTDGLSVGVDRAFGDQLLFGLAASIGRNTSDMDDSDARVRSDQRSLAAYGLWRGGDHVFVDGVLATGTLDFDTRRWSADADAFAQGKREGDQWFGSLSVGYEHRTAGISLAGYGRVEASRSTLDSYHERGAGLYDLVYREQVVRNSAVALGLEGAYLPTDPEARVRPFWSIEYRQALDDKGDAYMNYVVGPRAQDYQLRMQSYNDHALSIAAGMDVRLQRGWFMSLLLGHEQTRGSSRASSIGLRVGYGAAGGASGTNTLGNNDGSGKQRCNPRRCPPQASAAPR